MIFSMLILKGVFPRFSLWTDIEAPAGSERMISEDAEFALPDGLHPRDRHPRASIRQASCMAEDFILLKG